MRVDLDRTRPIPLYRQVADAIRTGIAAGEVRPGERLPTTRELARRLGVTRLTVVHAYEALSAVGLIEGRVGRGTFVAGKAGGRGGLPAAVTAGRDGRPVPPAGWPAAEAALRSAAAPGLWWRQLARLAERPGVISFASGMPAPDLFPVRALREAIDDVLDGEGAAALQYDAPEGYQPLREAVADYLAEAGVPARAGELLVTSGTQQGVDLIARVLLRRGDVVATENPTYAGALDVFEATGARVVALPPEGEAEAEGALAAVVRRLRPRLIYTIPACQGTAARPMSPSRRDALLRLAEEVDAAIVEDDAYRELCYGQGPPPPFKASGASGRVLHAGSFSKLLAPGLRVGYLLAPARWLEPLAAAKQAADLHTSSLLQRAVARILADGRLRAHVAVARQTCLRRRDAMAAALERELRGALQWWLPEAGPFIWARLPEGRSALDAYLQATDHGVAFAVGAAFMADRAERGLLRLNFSIHPEPIIDLGIERLGRSVAKLPVTCAAPI